MVEEDDASSRVVVAGTGVSPRAGQAAFGNQTLDFGFGPPRLLQGFSPSTGSRPVVISCKPLSWSSSGLAVVEQAGGLDGRHGAPGVPKVANAIGSPLWTLSGIRALP